MARVVGNGDRLLGSARHQDFTDRSPEHPHEGGRVLTFPGHRAGVTTLIVTWYRVRHRAHDRGRCRCWICKS